MPQYLASTPKSLTPDVLAAIREQCPGADAPVFLDVRTHPLAAPGRCYEAVDLFLGGLAVGAGGTKVYGWLVWEQPGVFLALEHHAVAEVGGELVDVSRYLGGERRVVFAPDPTARVPWPESMDHPLVGTNRYHPLCDTPLAGRLVGLKRRNDALYKAMAAAENGFSRQAAEAEWRRNDAEAARLIGEIARRSRAKKQKVRRRR